jgi:hypothetical protein
MAEQEKCQMCGAEFQNKEELQRHNEEKHPGQAPPQR